MFAQFRGNGDFGRINGMSWEQDSGSPCAPNAGAGSGGGAPAPGVSVVVPVFNEEGPLPSFLHELVAALPPDGTWEAVLVDDGSSDATPGILDAIAAADPRFRVLHLARNSGQSAAFFLGFRAARGEILATLDADGQNDPSDLPRLVAAIGEGADVACGWRQRRRDSLSRRLASRIAGAVRRAVIRDGVVDTGCSVKAFRRRFIDALPYWDGMHRFLPALCAARGARIVQMPVNHRPRTAGRSKYSNFGRLLRTIPDLLGVRWLMSREKELPEYTSS